jgi:hypothetical protein
VYVDDVLDITLEEYYRLKDGYSHMMSVNHVGPYPQNNK